MAEFKLGRIKFVFQGTWASNTSYVVDDVVTVGGKTYICVISNTSSSLFTTDLNNVTPYWNLIADGQSWKGSWSNSTYYNLGDMVSYGGIVYTCNTAHTSASVNATISITSATSTSGAATLTFTALSSGIQPYLVGTSVTVSSFSNANFNGTFTVTACTATTVSFTIPGSYTGTGTTGSVVGTGVLGLELNQSNWTAFASSLNWTGTWSINTRYKLDDFVYYGGITYVCTTAHVSANTVSSGLEQDSSKWSIFNAGLNYLGTWQTSTRYKLNDIVKYGADLFICTTQHTSSGTAINTSNFSIFVNGFEFMNSWSSSNNYAVGDVVTYGGYTYTAIQNSTSGSPQIPSTATAYWQVFTTGLNYSGAWVTGTSYKIGNIVTLGAFTYVALADNSASQPTASNANWGQLTSGIRWNAAPNTTYTNVASSNVSATGSGSPTFDVTLSGTSYSAVIHTGSAGTGYTVNDTLKILGTALGGISSTNDLVVKVVSITGGSGTGPIATVAVVTGYAVTWKTGTTYVVGDAVYYGNSSYICISAHIGGAGVNDPISDTTGTYWNILASGADSGALTTQGDIVYYGVNGPTRLPVGTDGQILRVNGNTPAWQYYGQLQNVVYVAPNGVDANTPGRGLTIDAPWASILYACKQIEDGYLNPNAGLLLKINKQFMMKETNNFILNCYSYNVTGTSASGNTFIVGGSSTSSQITTSTMYYGMPITFSAATGGVTPGTVYYVNSIPSSTTFTVSVNYQTGTPLGITPSSSTTSTATFNYSSSKAERDTGTVIDAVIFDLTHGGNLYVSTAAQAFFATITSFITTNATYEMPVWIASLEYLENTLFVSVLSNSAPSNNYQTLNGISSGNRAVQNITSVTSIETGSATIAQNLLDIITNALTAGTYANIPQLQRPHTSIYVKTGTYNEYGPIVVPQDTAILGDELRSTIVQVAGAQPYLTTDVPKTTSAICRIQQLIPAIVNNVPVRTTAGVTATATQQYINGSAQTLATTTQSIVTNVATLQSILAGGLTALPGYASVTVTTSTASYTVTGTGSQTLSTPTGFGSTLTNTAYSITGLGVSGYTGNVTGATTGYDSAVTNINANILFLQQEVAAYLEGYSSSGFSWTALTTTQKSQTLRDIAFLLQSVKYDLTYGGNTQSQIDGLAYWSLTNNTLTSAAIIAGTTAALTRVQTVIPYIINGTTAGWTKSANNNGTQVLSVVGTNANAALYAQALIGNVINWINGTNTPASGGSLSTGYGQAGTVLPALSWESAANLAAYNSIQTQRSYIQTQIQTFVATQYSSVVASLSLTYRDAGTIIDALSYDMLLGTNYFSIVAGRAFYRANASAQALIGSKELQATQDSIDYISYILGSIASNLGTLPATVGDAGNTSAVTLVSNNIAIIQNMFSGNTVITGPNNSAYPNGIVYQPAFSMPTVTGYNTSYLIGYGYAVTQLQNNYQFITDEIRNFLNNDTNLTGSAAWTNYSSTYQAETFRDLSNILDALQYDLTYGCNDQSMIAGRAFYSLNTALLVSPWLQGVKEALGRLSLILQPILLATPTANWNASYGISVSSGNTTSQSTSGTAGSAAAVSFAQSRITDILNWINTGFQDTSAATFTGSISSTTLTVSSVTGTIKIGQVVTGGTVAAGTYITAGSGTSWTVSVSQTATATGSTITISPVASGAAALAIAANLASFNAIQAQKQLIQNDAQAWVQRFFQNESPSLTLTNRDAGYIVDALSYDVLFNSNFNSIINGRAFNRLIPLVAALQANFADATYGSIGFIGSKVKLIAANGAVAQTSAVIDDMISQLRGQPTNNASLTGTVNGIQLSVSNISNGKLAAGMALTGTGINSGTSLVSGATISITGAYISSTSGVFSLAAPLTTALVVGQQVTISGTFSAGSIATPSYVSGTTYYVIGNPTTSTFQLSATQGGSAVTTTTGGSSGSPITGITITASPTTWLLNYSQSVSSTTTAITTVSPTTNYVTMGTTTGMVPGLQITISGTSISNLTAGTYYIKQVLSATQLTLSQSYNGSVFAITANNTLSSVQITGTNGQFSCSAVSTSLAIGQPVVISGTFGGTGSIVGYTTPTTYYIIATNGSTTFTLSTAAGGSAIVTTVGTPSGLTYTVGATGAMTAVVYGIYGGLGLTTSITASGTAIPVSAVTTSTNLITVSSNANMYVNMPIVFAGLPSNITTTATTISSSSITLGGTVSSLGVVVGQQVWFTGVMPAATGTTGTITFNQVYYVKTASASAITISATLGGTALTLNNATGLSLTATFNAAGGLVNGTQYWVNSVTAGTYPAAGTTITVTNTYKSGTAFVITNSLTGLTATCTVGIPTPQYIASKIVNGTAQVWGNPTSSYQSYPGYNNTLTTINGAEIIRANKTFLATEAVAYVSSVYSATVTGTTASTNIITTSSAHNFVVGDVIQFVAGGGAVFGNLPSSPVWVLSTPSNTTFTISSTQPGTGTQTAVTMTTTSGSCTAVYYILTDKAVRDASYHIDGLVYDLGLTGNYKSLRSAQLYLTAVNGSTTVDLFHVRNGTGIRNMTLNGLTGSLGLPNNLGTRRPTAGAYTSLDPGFGPNDSSVWANIRSCYVQNVTNFGNGCVGLKIDAALHNGGNKSILGNDYTQVLSDGIGVWATGHGALTECVSVFNYYCYSGYLAEYGARIRATNGNSSYGFYGVIAEGTDSFETPIYATLNNRYNQAYITNVVTDAANQIYRIEYENAGNGYTNGVPSISGAGYNAAAVQDEYRDSAVFETRLVDLNNGQGVGGSNYLTATNVAQIGAVGSITIANSDTQLSSAYVGMRTQITAGSGVGQYANIISYRSDTKIANIVRPTFATLTITNSSTSVFTVATTNTLYASQPIYIGAAVAGLSTATVYYVVGASLSNNGTTFSVATTAANAASNTAITLTATSSTPAVLAGCTIVGTALTITSVTSGTIYVGMLLTGTGIAANTYIVSGSGLNWVVSVSQNLASTGLTGTISVPLYEAGWDHAIPGASVQPVLDATSTYIIEPAVSYTGPGFKSAAQTLSGSGNTWSGLTYGAGYFVATATSASVTSYSTNGTTWTSGGALPASTSWSNVVYGGGQGATATAVVGGIGGSGAILTPVLGSKTTSGQIVSITVTNGGYNYTTPPTIVITDASGTGATAICQVLNGTIQSVTMVVTGSLYANPTVTVVTSELSSITANTWGQNYFSAPTVTIAAPFTATAWSNGGSVTAGNYYYYVDTTVSPNVRNYYLASGTGITFSSTAPTFTNAIYGKSGYGAPGTYSTGYGTNVTLTYAGTLAVAVANLTNNGVSSFTVTQSGFGYTTAPAITVVDPYAGFLAISSASTANAWNLPSTLGSAWTNNSNVLPTSTMTSLAYGNNLFIAVGGSGSAAAASLTNTTGPSGTWVNQSSAIIANTAGYSRVAYGNGTFVAIGGTVSAYMISNPAAWTSAGAVTNKTWTGLAYGNGRFVALASDGTLQYNFMTWGVTSNGSASSPTWLTVKNNPLNTSGITTWSNLRYSEGLFVAIATSSQTVATSWDGLNWSVYTSTLGMPSSSNWTNIAFGNLQNATLGAVPTWVAISNTSGTIAATIQTGATPAGRAKVVNNQVSEIRMIEPGGGFPRGNASATTTSTNVITVDSTVNLTANQPIVFNGTTTGSGITAGTYYYVVGGSITTTQFQISLTAGGTAIPLNSVSLTGVTYFASPTVTITDPNHVNTAPVVARIGNGVLGNPSFSNRGTSNSTATASYSGDGYADLYQTGTFINVSGLYQIPTAGCNVTFSTIPNTWYKLVAVTNVLGLAGNYTATFQINPGLSTLLAPVHNTQITTNLLYSNARLTGHDFLYIGTGGFASTNYPNVDATKAVQANQQLQTGGGRVFFTSTDQDGNFNVGNLFGVQQSTGTATLNASAFNLSGLQSLTLGSVSLGVGSATITQFSTDPYFTANSDSVVPTQKAIKAFITAQIGGGQSSLNVNTITSGQIYIAGNTIQNTTGNQIYVSSKMLFTGGIDGSPVALLFFTQK